MNSFLKSSTQLWVFLPISPLFSVSVLQATNPSKKVTNSGVLSLGQSSLFSLRISSLKKSPPDTWFFKICILMILKYAFLALIHSQLPFQKVYNISICIFDSTVSKEKPLFNTTWWDHGFQSWSSPNLSIHIRYLSSPFKSNLLASISRINPTSSHHLIHSSLFLAIVISCLDKQNSSPFPTSLSLWWCFP